ncbi:ATP dependent DNA ligase [Thermocrinis albus DSM 14484]|uniref:ATP dependent DNA ligase n=1 Tax=Thermocrinis albus (strain DSM 14484 / JCM 11386 / HI 11/12) TaxID=638303 RepID=D3SL17_THEAH|nr:RNA ligase [Thermocrinis albus]ADC89447.1 ATP dependent DNA ligase [Thermocrinis albus DSM 14484]
MLSPELVKEALRKNKVKGENYRGLEYLRFTDDFKDIPRGTILFKESVIWGYPHIGRIFQLSSGLREQFNAPFFVEEKVDGYNVRIFYHEGQVLAVTRGGFVCPFTTDRVEEFIDADFFKENPHLVLCAEVAGPENPYVDESPPYIREDIRFFVFDVMVKGEQRFLPYRQKLQLIEKYRLPSVERYGLYDVSKIGELKALLRRLNEEGREGVVFKEDSERDKRVKYITSYANLQDIRITSLNLMGLPADYYTNRLLRLALFMEEEGLQLEEDLLKELGSAFLEGIFEAIRQSKEEGRVYRTFRCRFRKKESALLFMEQIQHSSSQVQIIERGLKQEGSYWILEFDRVYLNMTGFLGHVLGGGSVFD